VLLMAVVGLLSERVRRRAFWRSLSFSFSLFLRSVPVSRARRRERERERRAGPRRVALSSLFWPCSASVSLLRE